MKVIKHIALVAAGLIAGAVIGETLNKKNITVTDHEGNLIADINEKDAIYNDDALVYINGKKLS